MKEIIVTSNEANQRADKFLMKYFNQASKSFIYKMFRKKRIKLNKNKITGNEILQPNDQFQIFMAEETIDKFSTANITKIKKSVKQTFKVIFEDENILLANKPVGLLAQPDGSDDFSLVEEITHYLIKTKSYNPESEKGFRPGICNRLDRNTSGIILAGKNVTALQALNDIVSSRNIDKHYLCIVCGQVKEKNTIEGYLTKNIKNNKVSITNNKSRGQYIKTIYTPIKSNGNFSLLDVQIITGKSHQIRAHLSSIGHPIIGDFKYGTKSINEKMNKKFSLKYQLLHAYKVKFYVDDGVLAYLNKKEFKAELPEQFNMIKSAIFDD